MNKLIKYLTTNNITYKNNNNKFIIIPNNSNQLDYLKIRQHELFQEIQVVHKHKQHSNILQIIQSVGTAAARRCIAPCTAWCTAQHAANFLRVKYDRVSIIIINDWNIIVHTSEAHCIHSEGVWCTAKIYGPNTDSNR